MVGLQPLSEGEGSGTLDLDTRKGGPPAACLLREHQGSEGRQGTVWRGHSLDARGQARRVCGQPQLGPGVHREGRGRAS